MDSISKKPAPNNQNTDQNQQTASSPATSTKTNTLAVVALILAIIAAPVGLVLGIIALSQVKKTKESGKGLAIASIVVSIIIMILAVIPFILWSLFFNSVNTSLKQNGVNIDTKSGSLDIKNKEGDSLSIGNGKLPKGFPSDVPIYPGSTVTASSVVNGNYNVVLSTKDSKSKVDSYYQNQLQSNGWSVGEDSATLDSGNVTQKTFTKSSQSLSVITAEDSNNKGTSITLSVVNSNQ